MRVNNNLNLPKVLIHHLAVHLLDKRNPSVYNQAIMDFGAIMCKPQNPLCENCPFSSECKALQLDKINLLPIKSKKLIKTERHFHYFVLYDSKNIYISQRTENDIWNGLFEFPVEEVNGQWSIDNSDFIKKIDPQSSIINQPLSYKQTLSHQYINGYFHEISVKKLPKLDISYLKIKKSDILNYAFPKIIRSYLENRLIFIS